MTIWVLLTNITDDDIKTYGLPADVMKRLGPGFPEIKLMMADKIGFRVETGNRLSVTYENREVPLPDAFWPVLSNTDAFSVEKALMAAGARCLVDLDDYAVIRSKSATYQRLAAHGFKVPRTVVFFSGMEKETIAGEFDYPFIIKKDSGYGGQGVDLIENETQLDEYFARLEYGVTYNAQEFIATSRGRDLRVVIFKNKFFNAEQRKNLNPDEFKSNVHAGGSLSAQNPGDNVKSLCESISRLFKLPLIGIDLLYGETEDDYTVCEVNAFPGLENGGFLPIFKELIADILKAPGSADAS